MTENRTERTQILAESTSAVSWSIKGHDDVAISSINLQIGVAPTTAGSVTVRIKNEDNATINSLIRTVDAVGATDIVIENIPPIDGSEGYYLLVEYTNADTRTISGFAVLDY